jgi:hypothetical protein
MRNVKMTVGGPMEEDTAQRFVDTWHRAERGEPVHERHLAFESWDALARVLTGKRMELLKYVRRHKVASVRALAKALRRDYSNVHADVQAPDDGRLARGHGRRLAGRLRRDKNEDRDVKMEPGWGPWRRKITRSRAIDGQDARSLPSRARGIVSYWLRVSSRVPGER